MSRLGKLSAAGAALAIGGWAWASVGQPYAGFSEPKLVEIPRGTSSKAIATMLAEEGVLRWEWQFWLLRALHPGAKLQAGEYRFEKAESPREVFGRLIRGDVFYYELRVPEGSSVFDIARSVEALGVMAAGEFLEAALDGDLIRDLAPEAPSLEGYLFPSTYRITRSTTPRQICLQMTDQFRQVWRQLGYRGDVHEAVTLASLVEKETGVAEERPLVASVFRNRLERGYKLDCDPTTIYAAMLERRYDGIIHRSDLDSKHRYNTYQHVGLPPGPIANPGIESLRAVMEPVETDFLFFVAKPGGNGTHQFSATNAEHEQAVSKYRRGKKKRGNEKKPAAGVAGRTGSKRG